MNTRLRDLGARLSRLFGLPKLNDPLDLAVGAVHALARAEELDYQHRPFPLPAPYYDKVKNLAGAFVRGQLVTNRSWLAGFYFNSALLRIAADYHQILKLLTKKKNDVPQLLMLVTPPFVHTKLDKVHQEVNKLKHEPRGVAPRRTVTFGEASEALEQLVKLIEERKQEFS